MKDMILMKDEGYKAMEIRYQTEDMFYRDFLPLIAELECGRHYAPANEQHVRWLRQRVKMPEVSDRKGNSCARNGFSYRTGSCSRRWASSRLLSALTGALTRIGTSWPTFEAGRDESLQPARPRKLRRLVGRSPEPWID